MSAPAPSADRNLLFGILAVQLDFVTKDALIAAMNAWLLDKAKPLGDILRGQGHLSAEELQHLAALVDVHLKRHGNDPQRSLAALSSVPLTLRQQLAALSDADVQQSVGHVGTGRQEPPPEADPFATKAQPEPPLAPPRYRILRLHAKGGLGEVFVAEDKELGRHVALKEIQGRHADDPVSRERFVREAEITGGLEHPGVVPVYGLGTYLDGRPFYAMRFIRGDNLKQAIHRFHGESAEPRTPVTGPSLSPAAGTRGSFDSLEFRQLLRRFIDVCNAVAYAHSRGVLHRDLKPGNVMLGKYGETLVVDWGLAKPTGSSGEATDPDAEGSLHPRSGGESSATVMGQALGTPAYMSPEQAAGELDKLGPATDIYSLGATVYELLTGQPPFAQVDLDAVQKGLFATPRTVIPAVPRSMEAVCLKAMAVKPADRYGSALDLAKEVERWLADEPVAAWREPAGVRLRRWVRKHARLVTGGGAALVVGALGLTVGLIVVSREQAKTAEQRDRAEENLAFAKKGNELLGSVFAGLDPTAHHADVGEFRNALKANLKRAVAELEGTAIGDPLAVADMQRTLGISLYGLGQFDQAAEVFERVRKTRQSQLGPDHPDTLDSMNNLAISYDDLGRLNDALKLYEETLALRKAKLGPDHPDTLASMTNLANSYAALGRHADAVKLRQETLALQKAKLGPDHLDTLASMTNLANSYAAFGRHADAVKLRQETLALQKAKLGPDHPDTMKSMNNLANSYAALGRHADAVKLRQETLALQKAKLGPDHPDTMKSMNNLANSYAAFGRHADAVKLREETLALRKAKLGPDHPDTLKCKYNLANSYRALGRHADAVKLREETLALQKAKLGPDHPDTLANMWGLAESLIALNRGAEAVTTIDDCLKRAAGKIVHPRLVPSVMDLRLRAFEKVQDAAGCRQTAEMWEKLHRTDAGSIYTAACMRAVTVAVIGQTRGAHATPLADDNADRAMTWLRQALAAGFQDIANLLADPDLAPLRSRPDYAALLWDLADTPLTDKP